MNDELKTTEYFKSMEHIKLSDSSRERIKDDLLAHARFHAVTEEKISAQPIRSPFLGWLPTQVPAVLVVVLLVGTTTSLLAKDAAPGDFLYALKTSVSENFRGVFAIGTKNEVDAPSETAAEQVAEAPAQQTDEIAPSDTTTTLTQNDSTLTATPGDTTLAINARTKMSLEESTADVASGLSTMLSQGTWSIEDHIADLKRREDTLRDLIKKYDAALEADIKYEFNTKLDQASALVAGSEGTLEEDARASLDKASGLVGEVEAKLSTLGQVIVEDGIIIDIDLSVDLTVPHAVGEGVTENPVEIDIDAGAGLNNTSGLGL